MRARIYTYSDIGTEGLMNSRYTFSVERWCRFELPSGREQTLAAQANRRLDGVVAFSDEVSVSIHDLLVINEVQYKVVEVVPRRQQREIICQVVLGDEDPNSVVES
jgi:hypothetical protein